MLTILEVQPQKVVPTPVNIPSISQYEISQSVETLTADVLSWCLGFFDDNIAPQLLSQHGRGVLIKRIPPEVCLTNCPMAMVHLF